MNESDIEAALRRHRPIGPPAYLRDRVITPMHARRVWPWAAAAAMLLISMLTLRIGARAEAAAIDHQLGPSSSEHAITELTAILGGTADARELAESMVMEEQARVEAAPIQLTLDQPGERP